MNLAIAMPTSKQRVTLNLPPDLYDALEACARRSNRTLANQAAMALSDFLVRTGDLSAPSLLGTPGRPRKPRAQNPEATDQSIEATTDE
jgi:hypothetical protein